MWYLVDIDYGIVDRAKTKRDLVYRNGIDKCTKFTKGMYDAYDIEDGYKRRRGTIANGEKILRENGYGWVFDEPQEVD